jgi:hypothetical protein
VRELGFDVLKLMLEEVQKLFSGLASIVFRFIFHVSLHVLLCMLLQLFLELLMLVIEILDDFLTFMELLGKLSFNGLV